MKRRLLATRRVVPLDRSEEYDEHWVRVRDAVEAAGGRAWRFRAARRQDQYMEFIEARELDAILERAPVVTARGDLDDAFGRGKSEEWEEAATS